MRSVLKIATVFTGWALVVIGLPMLILLIFVAIASPGADTATVAVVMGVPALGALYFGVRLVRRGRQSLASRMSNLRLAATNAGSIRLDIGSVESLRGRISISVQTYASGNGHLQVHCTDPSDGRKSGILVALDVEGLRNLWRILKNAESTIAELRATGQLKTMTVTFE